MKYLAEPMDGFLEDLWTHLQYHVFRQQEDIFILATPLLFANLTDTRRFWAVTEALLVVMINNGFYRYITHFI